MDGRPAALLDVKPTEVVDTYDTTPIGRLAEEDTEIDERILDQLRELGYVE